MSKRSNVDAMSDEAKSSCRLCRVCGDRALCVNFSVVSCESCKSFFRRNGNIVPFNLKCSNGGNCEVTVSTRKSCKRCRLAKCLKLGMRIQKEKAYNYGRMSSKNQNADIYPQSVTSTVAKRPELSSVFEPMQSPSTIHIINNCLKMEEIYRNRHHIKAVFPECLLKMESVDRELIYELWEAAKCMLISASYLEQVAKEGFHPSLHHPMNARMAVVWMESSHRKIIAFCQNVNSFRSLILQDQKLLIKCSLRDIFFILHLQCFNKRTATFDLGLFQKNLQIKVPFDEVRNLNNASFDCVMRYLESFDPDWQCDRTLLLLLIMVLVFDRTSDGLIDLDSVQQRSAMYNDLLKKYLKTQFDSDVKAEYNYTMLLDKLSKLRNLEFTPAFSIMQAAQLMQNDLLDEYFDLKYSTSCEPVTNICDISNSRFEHVIRTFYT